MRVEALWDLKADAKRLRAPISVVESQNSTFQLAAGEIASGEVDKRIWAEALVIADDDPLVRETVYTRMRVEALWNLKAELSDSSPEPG